MDYKDIFCQIWAMKYGNELTLDGVSIHDDLNILKKYKPKYDLIKYENPFNSKIESNYFLTNGSKYIYHKDDPILNHIKNSWELVYYIGTLDISIHDL